MYARKSDASTLSQLSWLRRNGGGAAFGGVHFCRFFIMDVFMTVQLV